MTVNLADEGVNTLQDFLDAMQDSLNTAKKAILLQKAEIEKLKSEIVKLSGSREETTPPGKSPLDLIAELRDANLELINAIDDIAFYTHSDSPHGVSLVRVRDMCNAAVEKARRDRQKVNSDLYRDAAIGSELLSKCKERSIEGIIADIKLASAIRKMPTSSKLIKDIDWSFFWIKSDTDVIDCFGATPEEALTKAGLMEINTNV